MEVDDLAQTLEDFHKGKISRKKVLERIGDAKPLEISKAEQKLLDEGVSETELKEFCKIHLEAVEEKVEKIKAELEEDHPLHILISEHEEIEGFLAELEELGKLIEEKGFNPEREKKLRLIAENLVESEKHHEREEETIFPRLEKRGIDGPPRIMRQDHNQFKPKKKRLMELSESPDGNRGEILELIDFLTINLRDHIFKENNVLYPTALDELANWNVIKEEGRKIGVCDFSSYQ